MAQASDVGGHRDINGCLRDTGHICPRCRNVQATAIRQLHTQLQHAGPLLAADHSKNAPFMGVSLTSDRHTNWTAMKRGNLT
jgi:hypothetical protein